MKDIINWYVEQNPLTEEEYNQIIKHVSQEKIYSTDEEFNKLEKEYFNRLPYCNLTTDTSCISFDAGETEIIVKIFEKYVDDETLVIYSDREHPSVVESVEKCKNILKLNYSKDIVTFNFSIIEDKIKDYSKVFVILNGTQVGSAEVIPQYYFIKLKELLRDKETTLVLDAAQEMFLSPRDYSIYDFVLGTAHAVVDSYDIGICISNHKEYIAEKVYNWGNDYLKSIDIVLKRMDKLRIFKYIMSQYFYYLIPTGKFRFVDDSTTVSYLFNIEDVHCLLNNNIRELLRQYKIEIDGIGTMRQFIRFRCQEFLESPEKLIDGVKVLDKLLKEVILE